MTHKRSRVYLGSDHRGYVLKEQLQDWLVAQGYQVEDRGSHAYVQDDDYPDVAAAVASSLELPDDRGILLCGSSIGVTMAANKVAGVRAGAGFVADEVAHARDADDINVLCLAADYLTPEQAQQLAQTFLETPFGHSERAVRRLQKLAQLDRRDE